MRSEKEMFDLILEFAHAEERVRAVILDGSRADPQAPRDELQDYDIVYVVSDMQSFMDNPGWIDIFGERMILQLPDDMGDVTNKHPVGYTYLMQFMDGTRIDLTLYPADKIAEAEVTSYCYALLDKDGILPGEKFRDASHYLPTPPTAKEFADCCNEFWWVSPYVAKGLARDEIIYAKHMHEIVREELAKMLTWYIGVRTGFRENPGKYGKRWRKLLEPELWELLLQTYADATLEGTWKALFSTCDLFRLTAPVVAAEFGLTYPGQEDERVYAYLEYLHKRGLVPQTWNDEELR